MINELCANGQPGQDETIAPGAIASARAVRDRVQSIERMGSEWSIIGGAMDHIGHLKDFEVFFSDAIGVLSGASVPKADPPRTDRLAPFLAPVRSLALEVLREISFAPILDQSILRLRVALETFEKKALLAQMELVWRDSQAKSAKNGKKAQRANEQVLQTATDQFLFGEGVLPLTHFQASGGLIDSMTIPTTDFAREATAWLREYVEHVS